MNLTKLFDQAIPLSPGFFQSISSCLVLAPHPDDESLGCGGLIASMRNQQKEVFVIFTTDGSMSHPGSVAYPPESVAAIRRVEATNALQQLGVPEGNVFFMNKKDGALPAAGEDQFVQNTKALHLLIALLQPDLVLVPYEKDPHRDHRATWQMLMNPPDDVERNYRILEYLIWLYELGQPGDVAGLAGSFVYLDIGQWVALKKEAIEKHVSQTTRLINDDPDGFMLSAEVLRHFDTDCEYYINRQL